MRGRFVDQGRLFSYVSPEARVPAKHPLRAIRALVRDVIGELDRSRSRLYASEGRPSIPLVGHQQHLRPPLSGNEIIGQVRISDEGVDLPGQRSIPASKLSVPCDTQTHFQFHADFMESVISSAKNG